MARGQGNFNPWWCKFYYTSPLNFQNSARQALLKAYATYAACTPMGQAAFRNPETVFSFRPLKTTAFDRLPRAMTLTAFFFMTSRLRSVPCGAFRLSAAGLEGRRRTGCPGPGLGG